MSKLEAISLCLFAVAVVMGFYILKIKIQGIEKVILEMLDGRRK